MKRSWKILMLIIPWLPAIWFVEYLAVRDYFSIGELGYQLLILWIAVTPVFVVYLLHIIRNDRLSAESKVLWFIVNFVAWTPAATVYWFWYSIPRSRKGGVIKR